MAMAFAPLAEAGTVPRDPARASQLPPNVVQRCGQVASKASRNFPAAGAGSPRQGNQLTRKVWAPNGTNLTVGAGSSDSTGLHGGSNAWVPPQPIVQSGSSLASARKETGGSS